MMDSGSNNRQRTVAALAVMEEGADAALLTKYMSDEDGLICASLVETYSRESDGGQRIHQLVRQMLSSERFSSLAEIHPAWILEKLRDETPRVIGIILRSLPSKHVRYILKNMPPMLRAQIPDMVESFAVAAPVLEVIRRRFECHFMPMHISKVGIMGFEHLYYLKGEDLEEVIRDLGLTELAIALSGFKGKSLHAVYNRLGLKDAKRLQRRIRELRDVSPGLFRQARYTVLEVEGNHVGPDKMLMRIGLAALASAIEKGQEKLVRLVMQRLEPGDGYLLKRFIDERSVRVSHTVAVERQELILGVIAALAEEGKIDPSWSRFAAPEEDPIPLQSPDDSAIPEEETATVQ